MAGLSNGPSGIDLSKEMQKISSGPEQTAQEPVGMAMETVNSPDAKNAVTDSFSVETKRGGLDTVINLALAGDVTPEQKEQLNALKSALPKISPDQVNEMYKKYTESTQEANLAAGVAIGLAVLVAIAFQMNKPDPEGDARKLAEAQREAEKTIASTNSKQLDQYIESDVRGYTGDNKNDFKQAVLADAEVIRTKSDYMNLITNVTSSGNKASREAMKAKEDNYTKALREAMNKEQASRDANGFKN